MPTAQQKRFTVLAAAFLASVLMFSWRWMGSTISSLPEGDRLIAFAATALNVGFCFGGLISAALLGSHWLRGTPMNGRAKRIAMFWATALVLFIIAESLPGRPLDALIASLPDAASLAH